MMLVRSFTGPLIELARLPAGRALDCRADCRRSPLIALQYRSEDLGLSNFFASGSADPDVLATVAGEVRRHTQDEGSVQPSALRDELEISHTRLTNAVNLLEQAGCRRRVNTGSGTSFVMVRDLLTARLREMESIRDQDLLV